MKFNNLLKPLSSKIPVYDIYGFDIETSGDKNKFLMGSIVGKDYKKVFWDQDQMCEHIATTSRYYKEAAIFATNLGFDILSLFAKTKYFPKIKPILRGSSFICAKYYPFLDNKTSKNKHVLFLDTMNFAPFSVKTMGEVLNLPKLDTPSYILDNRPPMVKEYPEVERYNIRDSTITYKFAEWLQHEFNKEGAKMRITIASTAMDLFKRKYLKGVWYQEPLWIMEKIYQAYYGGRTEVLKRGYVKDLYYYDFNSLYPSVMTMDFPDVNYQKFLKKGNMRIIENYDGISKVDVRCPYMEIPFLPYRNEGKLVFPIGDFTGWYTNVELRKALELGYRINWIGEQIYYTRNHSPFENYVLDQYKRRSEHKENDNPAELINKLLMNSLYGKFAQKIHGKEKIFHLDTLSIEDIQRMMNAGKLMIIKEFAYFKEDKPSYIPHYIFPIYSVYVTAYARIKLWNIASQLNPYYMDTDSIITKERIPNSKLLGDLKLEYNIDKGIFVKPKMYAFVDSDGNDHIKVKGLPPSRGWDFETFEKFLKNPTARYTKFSKFRESNKRDLDYNQVIEVEKKLTLEDDKRNWKNKFNKRLQHSTPLIIT